MANKALRVVTRCPACGSLPRNLPEGFALDEDRGEVSRDGRVVASLTPTEAKILGFLAGKSYPISRGQICDVIYDGEDPPTENTVSKMVSNIRRKLSGSGITITPWGYEVARHE